MTPLEQEAEMVRLFYAEHWRVGTIASQLGVHTDVVHRVLGLGNSREAGRPRVRLVDPYREFIGVTLQKYPKLLATRLYDMIKPRGYAGSVRTLREYIAEVRPKPRREVYLRTETLPGEQAQVDWAYVNKVEVAGGERALWLFVLVLSHSRAMWAEFVLDLSVHSLCRSLIRSAEEFKKLPRQWLFDNPKTVVLERQGDAVRFHPVLLDLCSQMRVQPRLCAVARPQHKGKVERTIRYLRDRFLAGRTITSVEQGNRELKHFMNEIAHQRPHPVIQGKKVVEVLEAERERMLPLPSPLPPTEHVVPVHVDRQGFIRFDTNRYSVPSQFAEKTLMLVSDDRGLRVLNGATCVAQHERCWGKRQIIELASHREALLKERRQARDAKGRDRLSAVAPQFKELLHRWLDSGQSLSIQVTRAVQLLDLYGENVFAPAVAECVAKGLRDTGALAVACDRLRRERRKPMPIDLRLPEHVDDVEVIPHDLGNYDED